MRFDQRIRRRALGAFSDEELRAELARRAPAGAETRQPERLALSVDQVALLVAPWREVAEAYRAMHAEAVALADRVQRRLYLVLVERERLRAELALRADDDGELLAEVAAEVAAARFEGLGHLSTGGTHP